LDKQRCEELYEGDILVNINNINVHNMSHNEVVLVLKDCQINEPASIIIQRCIQNSPDKFRLKNKKLDIKNLYTHEANMSKTTFIDNRTQMSKIPNNILENALPPDAYGMANNSVDEYIHKSNNSWMHSTSPSTEMYMPTSMYNDTVPRDYINLQCENYSDRLTKSIDSIHYDMNNASKNEAR